jgi:hypothetical protein
MSVVIAPLAPAVAAYRLAFRDSALLALGDKPAFFLCILQYTRAHHLFAKSAQKGLL